MIDDKSATGNRDKKASCTQMRNSETRRAKRVIAVIPFYLSLWGA